MAMTRDDMESIIGPVDNQMAVEILAVGATEQELAQALFWMNADEALVNEGHPMPTGKVAQLIEIFEANAFEGNDTQGPVGSPQV